MACLGISCNGTSSASHEVIRSPPLDGDPRSTMLSRHTGLRRLDVVDDLLVRRQDASSFNEVALAASTMSTTLCWTDSASRSPCTCCIATASGQRLVGRDLSLGEAVGEYHLPLATDGSTGCLEVRADALAEPAEGAREHLLLELLCPLRLDVLPARHSINRSSDRQVPMNSLDYSGNSNHSVHNKRDLGVRTLLAHRHVTASWTLLTGIRCAFFATSGSTSSPQASCT